MSFEHTMTNHQKEGEFPKLIRDEIPRIIEEKEGLTAVTRTLTDDAEYQTYLQIKVKEEAEELSEAKTTSNILEEAADLYEIVDALLALKGMSRDDVLKVQAEKREKRGGFDKRILMLGKE